MQRLLALVAILYVNISFAQEFNIQSVREENGKVYVQFTIQENLPFERYKIDLYSSHNSFSTPLLFVNGISDEIQATDETIEIVWDAARELTEYNGDIQLELRGRVIYTPVHSPKPNVSAKLGKTTTLEWEGGKPSDNIRIELIRNGRVSEVIDNVQNMGAYDWNVSEYLEKGEGYKIRWVNVDNPPESYESEAFKISGKLGIAVKLSPLALLGAGAVVFLLSGEDEGGGDGKELPTPTRPNGEN